MQTMDDIDRTDLDVQGVISGLPLPLTVPSLYAHGHVTAIFRLGSSDQAT